MKILRHLSSRPDKTEYYHILQGICESELLSDFVIFKEAVSELMAEGKVERITADGRDLVALNIRQKNAGGF